MSMQRFFSTTKGSLLMTLKSLDALDLHNIINHIQATKITPTEILQIFKIIPKFKLENKQLTTLATELCATSNASIGNEYFSKIFFLAHLNPSLPDNFKSFLLSEVSHRLKSMRAFQLLRILKALHYVPTTQGTAACEPVIDVLSKRVAEGLSELNGQSISEFLPIMYARGLDREKRFVGKLNIILSKRLRGWKCSEMLLNIVELPIINASLTQSNVISWIWSSASSGFLKDSVLLPTAQEVETPQLESEDAMIARIGTLNRKNLFVARNQRIIFALKTYSPEIFSSIHGYPREWLQWADSLPILNVDSLNFGEPSFVTEPLMNLLEKSRTSFLPSMCGCYMLATGNPLIKTLYDWEEPWKLYSPEKMFLRKTYYNLKWDYLLARGWRIQKLKLE